MTPGPGNYAQIEHMGSGIKNSMASKFKVNPEDKESGYKPGVGAYDVDLTKGKRSAPKFSIGSSPRFDKSGEREKQFH